jgi:hypothetical protein
VYKADDHCNDIAVGCANSGRHWPVTLDHPGRVSRLVLVNTYYGTAPPLQFPEMIRLFADQSRPPRQRRHRCPPGLLSTSR